MSAILEIPEVRRRVSRLSVEEYHRLDEFNDNGRRTELIRGILIEKMSESPLHRTLASRLYHWLFTQLPEGYSVWKEEPLTLADSEPEPDISVTPGTEGSDGWKCIADPRMVVTGRLSISARMPCSKVRACQRCEFLSPLCSRSRRGRSASLGRCR